MTQESLNKLIEDFKRGIQADISATVNEYKQKSDVGQYKKGQMSLFDTLGEFDNLQVTQANAPEIINMFKLIERFGNDPDRYSTKWEPEVIARVGKELGFDENKAISIYYMTRYARAFANIESKKVELYKIVTGVA